MAQRYSKINQQVMIYYKIPQLFEKSGKSYRQLAGEIGLAYVTIAKIANARTAKDYDLGSRVIDKLCRYFKCKPEDVLQYRKR